MKILQINNYNYLKGGSEKVYFETIKLLKSHGHDVLYFSTYNSKNTPFTFGHDVKVVKWSDRFNLIDKVKGVFDFIYNRKVAKELDAFLTLHKPDIIHIHIYYGLLSNSILQIISKHKIPIVQSVHEYRLLCPAYTCLNSNLDVCERCFDKLIKYPCLFNRCVKSSFVLSLIAVFECFIRDQFFNNQLLVSRFIMVSKFIADKHITAFPILTNKISQIYNSVNITELSNNIADTDFKENCFIFIGRLSYEKGIFTLIDVFYELAHLKLKIFGEGPLLEQIRSYIAENNITNIQLCGFVSGSKLYSEISKAKFSIIPSEWYENNPLSIIESMSLGTPIIGSNIGGIPELIISEYNGFIFEPKNKKSLKDTVLKASSLNLFDYELMRNRCIHEAKSKFSNELYYSNILKVYSTLISKK